MTFHDTHTRIRRRGLRRRATIHDVACLAGVSQATVSAVFNLQPHFIPSPATRRCVLESAKRLQYRPKVAARALSGKATATLGLVVPNLMTEMITRSFVGFEATARANRNIVLTICNEGDVAKEDESIRWLLDRDVDGMVVCPAPRGRHEELKRLVDAGFPLVTFAGEGLLDFPTDDVGSDHFEAGRLQVQHLLSLGRRRVGIVDHALRCWANDQKIAGMERALSEAGLEVAARITLPELGDAPCGWRSGVACELRRQLRAALDGIDALAAIGDMTALGVMRCLAEMRVPVPDRVAVIGHDGITAGEVGPLPLSTVQHDNEMMGRRAFEMLQQRIAEGWRRGAPRREIFKPTLVRRASTLGIAPADDSEDESNHTDSSKGG